MPNPSKTPKSSDIKQLMSKLETIVEWFETEDIDIAEALVKYEESLNLIKQIETKLAEAKVQVEKIEQNFKD